MPSQLEGHRRKVEGHTQKIFAGASRRPIVPTHFQIHSGAPGFASCLLTDCGIVFPINTALAVAELVWLNVNSDTLKTQHSDTQLSTDIENNRVLLLLIRHLKLNSRLTYFLQRKQKFNFMFSLALDCTSVSYYNYGL